ncbi:hypothetical protein FH972_005820 [Carpinus fangiana]|uniref:Putative plant transposon protein domain-containing protein n=1 Tax=Carpinus fangiana TaxID=176857 RepID=A0A5N6QSV4_9ROSI|nr:hypothetical protein FH972_005820 [Carpinus fangiana]
MASGVPTSRKLPIRSKTKAQKRKATEDASFAPDIRFRFQSKSAKKVFQDRFHDCTVIVERPVNLSDLQDEFYANMETQLDTDEDVEQSPHIVSFIRGVKIVVTHEVIAEVTGIPLIEEPGFPYPIDDFPSKTDMSKLFVPPDSYNFWQDYMNVIPFGHLSHPVKLLARIVMQNVFPIDHHSDLGMARGRFIYALLTDVHIDFASVAIRLMKAIFTESLVSLPYGSLISRIISKFIQILASEPTIKHLGPFCSTTVSRSKAQMRLRGTKDFEVQNDPANTIGPSGGCTTSSHVSLDDVMAKLNDMSTQMTGFLSILTGLQKDVNDLKTRFMGSS